MRSKFVAAAIVASLAGSTSFIATPADGQLAVIDVKAIAQLTTQLQILQQQLNQAIQLYQQTIQIANQAASINKNTSGLTNAYSLAPGLNVAGLQDPIPTASASIPGFVGGLSSAASLPFGSTYLQQNTIGSLPTDVSFASTQIRQGVNALSSLQALATNNLQALETRIAALPAIAQAIASASTVQQMNALQARLTGEQNYAAAQTAQANNLKAALASQIASIQLQGIQYEYQDGKTGIAAACSALASGLALTKGSGWLRDVRNWLDEERHRSRAWSGGSRTAGSGDRLGEQPAKACLAGSDCAAERRWGRDDGDPAPDRQRQADDLALAGALYGRRG